MKKIFRFNWNIQDFPFEICKDAYEKNSGIMFWRHDDKEIEQGTSCLIWLGTKGQRKAIKPLQGVVGIGVVKENKKHHFSRADAPFYLIVLADIASKPIENMTFAKVQVYIDFREALVHKETVKRIFDKGKYWPSGNGASDYIKDQEDANKLFEMTEEEACKRNPSLIALLSEF